MMAFQFIGPLIAAILYVIVFQKAGLRGGMLAFCAAPLVGAGLFSMMVRMTSIGGGPGMMLIAFVLIPLNLLPLLILAFKSWPPVAATNTRSES